MRPGRSFCNQKRLTENSIPPRGGASRPFCLPKRRDKKRSVTESGNGALAYLKREPAVTADDPPMTDLERQSGHSDADSNGDHRRNARLSDNRFQSCMALPAGGRRRLPVRIQTCAQPRKRFRKCGGAPPTGANGSPLCCARDIPLSGIPCRFRELRPP